MQTGKTIAKRRERPESDSERERVRKKNRNKKLVAAGAVIVFTGALIFLSVKAFSEWYKWVSKKEEVIIVQREPGVEIIDDLTGRRAEKVSSRVKEFVAELEEEFSAAGRKVVRAHIPEGKMREVDLEVEGFSGVIKVSLDRNAAVSAEDAGRMLKYLEEQGVAGAEYIDVRIERKGYWK
ncbi:hypothetical protein IJH89_00765 [Candidatus Saccharibacteria bacterium]|nr:hypothetical protein [Candidatus Saccharibacteria bacterium]